MGEKNTVDVLFKRDTLENIKNTPLKDGQVLWTIDQEGNDKIYNDVRQSDNTIKRTQIGGTIQVDQDFDKESPYPLANKKIVNGLKDFIPAYAKDLDILTDALSISTTDENFELNKTQLVSWGTTANMPEDCLLGIRDVGRGKGNPTYVRIFGRDKYGIPTEWFNSWEGTNWTGWARAITRNDLYIGYDSLINNVQKSVKIFKPTFDDEQEVAFAVSKNQTPQAFIDYSGFAYCKSIYIKDSNGDNHIIIDSNRDIFSRNISSTTITSKSATFSNLSTTELSTNNLTATGIVKCPHIQVGDYSYIKPDEANSLILYCQKNLRFGTGTTGYTWLTFYDYIESDKAYGVLQPDSETPLIKLGTTNHQWLSVNAVNYLQTSDKKAKTHIAYLKDENKLDEFYMNLKPVEYKWKNDGHRTHLGFYAQDIAKNANNTIGDLAMYQAIQLAKDKNGKEIEKPYSPDVEDKDLKWTLSYDELIAPTVAMVQKQQKEIEELKQQIENLKR